MTCYDGFGNLATGKHRFWVDGFGPGGGKQILFYHQSDHNWWLGTLTDGTIAWELVGNTAGFGNLNDGRPIWTGYFSNLSRAEVLFYHPSDHNWWLGSFSGNQLTWSLVGNTAGFGNLAAGKHRFWIDDFNADARSDVLFYYEGDHNWWLGSISAGQLVWRFAGNTASFGNLNDGRPMWSGYFNGVFRADMLFYYPGDSNWWLGTYNGSRFQWQNVGNTAGFGNLNDGRPIWTGNFKLWQGGTDVLFYYPGDSNWWLGSISGGQLTWNLVGNTAGVVDQWDPLYWLGRPFWIGDFNRDGQIDVLYYRPGNQNWSLGTISGTQLSWNFAGNTTGFGQVWDGRPFWVGDFNWDGKADILFYFPGDGNWWLGTHDGSRLQWSLAGNTGKPLPYRSRVFIHIKVVATTPQTFIDSQIKGIREVFDTAGIGVEIVSQEDLTGDPSLNGVRDVNVVDCQWNVWPWPSTSPDQEVLFQNRNFVGQDEIVVYIVRTISSTDGLIDGCATHPPGRPGCVMVNNTMPWVMAHEVGHLLGLGHIDNTDRLMNPDTGWTNTPPDLDQGEANWMDGNSLTKTC